MSDLQSDLIMGSILFFMWLYCLRRLARYVSKPLIQRKEDNYIHKAFAAVFIIPPILMLGLVDMLVPASAKYHDQAINGGFALFFLILVLGVIYEHKYKVLTNPDTERMVEASRSYKHRIKQ